MTGSTPEARPSDPKLAALGVAMVAAVSAWIRWPGFAQGGFASHDVGGILHEGMVLQGGELPYVATIELKSPGTFYLAWLFAGERATDIARFQVWANLWAIAALVAVGAIAWRLWGARASIVAAIVYALHDAHLDSMDANYVTWAQLPQVLAVGAGLLAARDRAPAWRTWLVAGVLAGLATLAKHPAGVVLPVLVIAASGPWSSQPPGVRAGQVAAILGGFALAHVPIVVHYAVHGELAALWHGYVGNEWALRYVVAGGEPPGLGAVREGVLATVYFCALALALAAFSAKPPLDPIGRRDGAILGAWALGTLAAAWVGFRFYKGYFLAPAAPLALLAAAPWGLLGTHGPLFRRGAGRGRARWIALVPALALALRQGLLEQRMRIDRARSHDEGGRAVARHIAATTAPGETLWVWGWHLWDVYALTGMRSASRVVKSLGLLTPPNDDTWRRPASIGRFVDGPAAQMVLDDLAANRPAWIVLGGTAPHREFTALHVFMREHYQRDRSVRVGKVEFWRRR